MGATQTKPRRWSPDNRADWFVPRHEIQVFVDAVVHRFRPAKVILFGSYAYGEPNADSDVDLLIIMPPRRPIGPKIATRIRLACPRAFPMDLLVESPSYVRRRAGMGDPFMDEVTSKGVVLYEADHAAILCSKSNHYGRRCDQRSQ
jgi:uncharacterized protein